MASVGALYSLRTYRRGLPCVFGEHCYDTDADPSFHE